MPLKNKTSANVVAWLKIENVCQTGIQLTQISKDAGIAADAVQEVQADMTLDGHLVKGYAPNPYVVNLTLQPTAPAIAYLREAQALQKSLKTPLGVELTVYYPATDRTYQFVNGVFTQMMPMPAANRVQDPVTVQMTFEDCQ